MTKDYDGKERRHDYQDNGLEEIIEEDGAVVHKVTILTLYRTMKRMEKNFKSLKDCQEETFKEVKRQGEKVTEINGHKQLLEEHIEMCSEHRKGLEDNEALNDSYERGRRDANKVAEVNAKESMKQSMYFWAKILIPAVAIILSLVYWLGDKFIL